MEKRSALLFFFSSSSLVSVTEFDDVVDDGLSIEAEFDCAF